MECTKVKFGSEEYALFHITKHRKKNATKGLQARAYLCPDCKCWHITSQVVNNELIEDNEALRKQLIEQIQKSVNLKAEVEVLKEHLKVKFKPVKEVVKTDGQIHFRLKKQNEEIANLKAEKSQLLLKLSVYIKP